MDIPELQLQARLPSDRYNQVALPSALQAPPQRQGFGLLGSSSSSQPAPPATPLQPYAGPPQRGLPPSPDRDASQGEEALELSQPMALQFSQSQQQQQQGPSPARPQHAPQIQFAQARAVPAHVARRKAATEAIARRAYQPPTVAPPVRQARGLSGAPALQKQGSGGQQQSLFAFGFTAQPRAAAGGPDDMDTDS